MRSVSPEPWSDATVGATTPASASTADPKPEMTANADGVVGDRFGRGIALEEEEFGAA